MQRSLSVWGWQRRLTWTGRRVEREAGRRPLLGRYTNLGWVLNGYSGSDFVELTKQ